MSDQTGLQTPRNGPPTKPRAGNPKDYHLSELRIATAAEDPRRYLPENVSPASRILDIGCGAGQTLVGMDKTDNAVGLDVDLTALQLGRNIAPSIHFVCGTGDALPFADASFDFVIARVSLPYMNIPAALREIRRVTKPGGRFWMALHTLRIPWDAAKTGGWKAYLFFAYVVLNGALFHFSGRQISFFGRRFESFQTETGMRRALREAGFANIDRLSANHFILEAS